MTRNGRIALFIPSLFGGGAERMMVNLAGGLAERGHPVDLLLIRAAGPYLADVADAVRVTELKARHVSASIPEVANYLRRERPLGLLSTLNHPNLAAIAAKHLARVATRVVVRQANTLSASTNGAARLLPRVVRQLVRHAYRYADGIVAVSDGVASDLARVTRLPRERIEVIPNPVVTPRLFEAARQEPSHPWFVPGGEPVVLAVGRLRKQKDFPTLLRAFDRVRRRRAARLVILGEGADRPELEALIRTLGLDDAVSLPGFVPSPFPYMRRAAVFVLSSAWEGLPGALIQALACGAPVVATDCESGPREILDHGRYGRLVPVGDAEAMGDAILAILAEPQTPVPRQAWEPFSRDIAVDRYLAVLRGRSG